MITLRDPNEPSTRWYYYVSDHIREHGYATWGKYRVTLEEEIKALRHACYGCYMLKVYMKKGVSDSYRIHSRFIKPYVGEEDCHTTIVPGAERDLNNGLFAGEAEIAYARLGFHDKPIYKVSGSPVESEYIIPLAEFNLSVQNQKQLTAGN